MRLVVTILAALAAYALVDAISTIDAACGDDIPCKIEMETP